MKLPIDLDREADFLVEATIVMDESVIDGIPCKVYLPERNYEKPYILLKPQHKDAEKITKSEKAALKVAIYGLKKELQSEIESPDVHFSGFSTKYWGDGVSDTTMPGEPQNLHVIKYFPSGVDGDKTDVVFWVSYNDYLEPMTSRSMSYTGEITCDRFKEVSFVLKDDVKIVFDTHYKYKEQKNRDTVSWSFLVATASLNISAKDVISIKDALLQDIDDFFVVSVICNKKAHSMSGMVGHR